jgi:FAD/FMN-containing dehydrogenase
MVIRLGPDDPRYDEARALHNGMVDKRPAVILQCADAAEVATGLAEAQRAGMEISVRAGGHSVAGMSTNDDGIVIDVRPMKLIDVDAASRRVRVGAGVNWGGFDRATQQHSLVTTGGRVSTTGVTGFTLGGGSGWIERSFGLACDNLISVDLVTADGRELTASASSHADLFWALHGGGGNFGVVTALEFGLHPLGPEVLAGLALWPAEQARDIARRFRDWVDDAPDALGSGLVILTGPPEEFVPTHLQGQPVIGMAFLWAGEIDDGLQFLEPMRSTRPAVDLIGPMPYADFQCMIDDPPGFRNWWSADYHDDFPDSALETFVTYGLGRPSALSQQLLLPWGGAVARVEEDSTPMTHRDAAWISHPFAMWEDAADDEANIAWGRGFREDIAEHTNGGVYLNFIGNEGQERIRAAFGEQKYERLAAIKSEYDPQNVFHNNQNILPASVSVPAARTGEAIEVQTEITTS